MHVILLDFLMSWNLSYLFTASRQTWCNERPLYYLIHDCNFKCSLNPLTKSWEYQSSYYFWKVICYFLKQIVVVEVNYICDNVVVVIIRYKNKVVFPNTAHNTIIHKTKQFLRKCYIWNWLTHFQICSIYLKFARFVQFCRAIKHFSISIN